MSQNLFRKKALDQITGPEQLNDYIHIVPAYTWLILAGVVLVIAGVLFFLARSGVNVLDLLTGRYG